MPDIAIPANVIDPKVQRQTLFRKGEQLANLVCLRTGYTVTFALRDDIPTISVLTLEDPKQVTLAILNVFDDILKTRTHSRY